MLYFLPSGNQLIDIILHCFPRYDVKTKESSMDNLDGNATIIDLLLI